MVVSATGAWPFAIHIVLVAYTIVAFNMDHDDNKQKVAMFMCLEDICHLMHDFCVEKKGNKCGSNLTIQSIDSTVDDERMQILNGLNGIEEGCNEFWSCEKCNLWLKATRSWWVGETVSLKHIVGLSYALCNLIYPEYSSIVGNMEKLILQRLLPEEYLDVTDNDVDGAALSHLTKYNGEMYLRRVYLVLKNEGMIGVNSDELANHFGSRQQCLYGYVCFVLLLFGMYDSDSSNIPNVDWLKQVVMNGGCAHIVTLNDVHKVGKQEQRLLYNVHGGAHKSISMCISDLVNTKNPSGGMIGPSNCLWFHNLILRLVGSVSSYYKKLMKNHACIHDACGFMMTFHDIGPGYVFGLFPNNALCTLSWMGQFSGLVCVHQLMGQLSAPFFNAHDQQDDKEEEM